MCNGWFWLVAQVADSQARRADFHINEQLEATGESLLHLVSRRQTDYVSVCIYVLIGSVLGRSLSGGMAWACASSGTTTRS